MVGFVIGYQTIAKRNVKTIDYVLIVGSSEVLALIGPCVATYYEREHGQIWYVGLSVAIVQTIIMGIGYGIVRSKLFELP